VATTRTEPTVFSKKNYCYQAILKCSKAVNLVLGIQKFTFSEGIQQY